MMGRTHMAFGLLAGIVLLPFFSHRWYLFIPLCVLGSLLPDVDHENSKINNLIPITKWVPKFFKHRGFFHTLFPVIIIAIGLHYARLDFIGIPLAIGYMAHLLSDAVTVAGLDLLHPITTLRIQGFIHTNGMMEFIVFGTLIGLNALAIVNYFF